ncbi:MAG: branched-chain-amino-acid transaminase [Verrucomicrobia bacterium]|nr:branched-chain-amino-acid transaminase [Verrucomicrobiota bacterium]
MHIYIDGEYHDQTTAKVSVFDHGLLYGDGVFEGIRFYNRRVFKLEEHIDRLYDSAKAICLTIPIPREQLEADLLECIRRNELDDGYIRLVVTRGVGDLGLNPKLCKTASIIIIAAKISLYTDELYQRGLDIVTCATRRISSAALPPAVKSLNYLNNVLAKIEAMQAGAAEALMLNDQGNIAECTADNVFVVKRGQIFTPPVTAGSLRGITRGVIFDLCAEADIPISEPDLTRYDVFTADECFLTGTAAEVVPVVQCDTRVIGDGRPGPVTQRLVKMFRELVGKTGTPIDKTPLPVHIGQAAEPATAGAR